MALPFTFDGHALLDLGHAAYFDHVFGVDMTTENADDNASENILMEVLQQALLDASAAARAGTTPDAWVVIRISPVKED